MGLRVLVGQRTTDGAAVTAIVGSDTRLYAKVTSAPRREPQYESVLGDGRERFSDLQILSDCKVRLNIADYRPVSSTPSAY